MATIVTDPVNCTFIHIPKTGGNSITAWLKQNTKCKITKRKQHADLHHILAGNHSLGPMNIDDLGWKFCVVRNPWDYCVSWYTFKVMLANNRLKYLQDNPEKIKPHKRKFNIELQQGDVNRLNQGFEWWLGQTKVNQQHKWAKDCDYIMKLENLEKDFFIVQEKLNCFIPLPHLNKTTTRSKNYKDYYTSQNLIDIVADKFKDDIITYGYDF